MLRDKTMDNQRKELTTSPMNCIGCESSEIATSLEQQTFLYGKEGVELHAEVPVRTCLKCGFQFTDASAEEARDQAIRAHLDVPSAAEVAAIRKKYTLSRIQFGQLSGLGSASLARWESGSLLPNIANARYLYLLSFADNFARLRSRYFDQSADQEASRGSRPCRVVFSSLNNIELFTERARIWKLRRTTGGG
jgi:putative zinc finger/helix-turn-helix YgiT family protein